MSRLVFTLILNEVLNKSGIKIGLTNSEKEQMYMELLKHFGLAGGLNVCGALEKAWQDPYNKNEIEDFIIAWLKRRMRKIMRDESVTGVV